MRGQISPSIKGELASKMIPIKMKGKILFSFISFILFGRELIERRPIYTKPHEAAKLRPTLPIKMLLLDCGSVTEIHSLGASLCHLSEKPLTPL